MDNLFTVSENYQVKLNFGRKFVLETCVIPFFCTCDHVKVRDGINGNLYSWGNFVQTQA